MIPHQKGKHAKAMPQFQGKSDRTYFHCGKPGHVASKCRFKDAQCHHCGKTNHLRAVCYGKAKRSAKMSGASHSVQQVQEQAETDEYSLLRLGPVDKSSPYNVGQVQVKSRAHHLSPLCIHTCMYICNMCMQYNLVSRLLYLLSRSQGHSTLCNRCRNRLRRTSIHCYV